MVKSLPILQTVFVPDLNPDISNNDSKLAKIIRKKFPNNQYFEKSSLNNMWKKKGNSILEVYRYDLGITEQICFCVYAIFNRIGLNNHITTRAVNLLEAISDIFGVSFNPSYVPAGFAFKSDKMNYLDRLLTNVIMYIITYGLTKLIWEPTAQSLQYHLPNKFDYSGAVKESSFVFVNAEELIEFPRLVSRKIVFVGGIAVSEASPLIEKCNISGWRGTNHANHTKFNPGLSTNYGSFWILVSLGL
ncbi:unnamed protein product [Cercopithifilaria johnstoni]|uniref:glucuronosyltransferase n=1 Tax=Cercopithifilaria johnstoni TaxID=2874296 RepID=A0A8J2Q045_9BILA|nr:unnamed protein product [Cercopithifilaria johnstoni]